jgi:hypothetical protein
LIVIKPDHYIVEKTMPATSSAKHGGKARVEVRFDVDPRSAPAGPERRGEDDRRYLFEPSLDCWNARFREDAAPAIPFLEILRGELPKHDLANEGRNAKADVALAGHVIYLLNSLPSRADSGSVAERSSSSEKALSSNMEATGAVFDAATKQPVQGAYVIAMYTFPRGRNTICWRTRGQVTGTDGKFRFPVEKTDGGNPREIHAMLVDHYTKDEVLPTGPEWKPKEAAFYRDRNIHLARQDPGNPSPRFYY